MRQFLGGFEFLSHFETPEACSPRRANGRGFLPRLMEAIFVRFKAMPKKISRGDRLVLRRLVLGLIALNAFIEGLANA